MGIVVGLLGLYIGLVAGLRTGTAVAAACWAAALGWTSLSGTPLAFLETTPIAAVVVSILALVELVADKLPSTPSRTNPPGFGARLVAGALSGAIVGSAGNAILVGLALGVVGAVIGTFGGHALRLRLAAKSGDRPIALLEDAVAIVGAIFVVLATGGKV